MAKAANYRFLIDPFFEKAGLTYTQKAVAMEDIKNRLRLAAFDDTGNGGDYYWDNEGDWAVLIPQQADGKIDTPALKARIRDDIKEYSNHRGAMNGDPPVEAEEGNWDNNGYVVVGGTTYCTHATNMLLTGIVPGQQWNEKHPANATGSALLLEAHIRLYVDFEY